MTASRMYETPARTLSPKQLQALGKVGSRLYARHGGVELVYHATGRDEPPQYVAEGEWLIATPVQTERHGTLARSTRYALAVEVAPGTYEQASAKEAQRKGTRQAPLQVWDEVARLPAFESREPSRILIRQSPEPLAGAMLAATGAQVSQPWIEAGGNEPPPRRMVTDYIALLRSHGILLDTARGRLVVKSRKPISLADRTLIDIIAPLLVGELDGKRLLCAFCDAEAVTMAYPNLPVCEAHTAG